MTETKRNIKPDNEAYANCMGEMKTRLLLIDKPPVGFLNGVFYLEFMCLQMRKVCELFAYATVTANRKGYEQVRKGFQHNWTFAKILKQVERVNPGYFPEAIKSVEKNEETGRTDIKGFGGKGGPFLSKKDIEKIYNECSDFVHAQNHYKDLEKFYPKNFKEFLPWKEKLIAWRDAFIKLLNVHIIGFAGENFIAFMYMEDASKDISVVSLKQN